MWKCDCAGIKTPRKSSGKDLPPPSPPPPSPASRERPSKRQGCPFQVLNVIASKGSSREVWVDITPPWMVFVATADVGCVRCRVLESFVEREGSRGRGRERESWNFLEVLALFLYPGCSRNTHTTCGGEWQPSFCRPRVRADARFTGCCIMCRCDRQIPG